MQKLADEIIFASKNEGEAVKNERIPEIVRGEQGFCSLRVVKFRKVAS